MGESQNEETKRVVEETNEEVSEADKAVEELIEEQKKPT